VIPLVCAIPKSSRHDTHHRIARFAAAISSHPKRSANRAAPSLIETRNQLIPKLQCCDQFLACRHADLPRQLVRPLPDNPAGSKLREATRQRELQF
jgi:hypothetical protein